MLKHFWIHANLKYVNAHTFVDTLYIYSTGGWGASTYFSTTTFSQRYRWTFPDIQENRSNARASPETFTQHAKMRKWRTHANARHISISNEKHRLTPSFHTAKTPPAIVARFPISSGTSANRWYRAQTSAWATCEKELALLTHKEHSKTTMGTTTRTKICKRFYAPL